MAKMQSPAKLQTLIIIGAMVAGVAIAASLFLLYPDMMLQNTSFDRDVESGFSGSYGADTGGAPAGSPQAPVP